MSKQVESQIFFPAGCDMPWPEKPLTYGPRPSKEIIAMAVGKHRRNTQRSTEWYTVCNSLLTAVVWFSFHCPNITLSVFSVVCDKRDCGNWTRAGRTATGHNLYPLTYCVFECWNRRLVLKSMVIRGTCFSSLLTIGIQKFPW